jgi:hypothetical protein
MSPNRGSTLSNSSHLGSTSHPSGDYTIPPTSSSALGSPGFSTTSSLLPSINQAHETNRDSRDFPPQESRRSSLGSQVNQGMGSLQINGASSPYTGNGSVNHSSTSLAQNLSRERGISSVTGLRTSRSSAQLPMSPMSPTPEHRAPFSRVAPPIGHNPRSEIYSGQEPVPGQAYAFPDAPDMEPGALPPKNTSRHNITNLDEDPQPASYSRRDSGHQSIASSIHTNDSRLPPGQRRLDDGSMPGTHHHSLQQNQMSVLSENSSLNPEETSQPYSRTPALRVSHKMAERKRRSEMKDLFENLRSQIPSNQGSKSSKWEILTKASDYIKQLENAANSSHLHEKQVRMAWQDLDVTRRDNDSLRNENQRLMQELQMLRQQQQQQPQPQQPVPPPQSSSMYGTPQHYVPPPPPPPPGSLNDPSRNLPPLTNGAANSSSMQGIQYHESR